MENIMNSQSRAAAKVAIQYAEEELGRQAEVLGALAIDSGWAQETMVLMSAKCTNRRWAMVVRDGMVEQDSLEAEDFTRNGGKVWDRQGVEVFSKRTPYGKYTISLKVMYYAVDDNIVMMAHSVGPKGGSKECFVTLTPAEMALVLSKVNELKQ